MKNDPILLNFDTWCIDLVDNLEKLIPGLYPRYAVLPSTEIVADAYEKGLSPIDYAAQIVLSLQPAITTLEQIAPFIDTLEPGLKYEIKSAVIKWYVNKIV